MPTKIYKEHSLYTTKIMTKKYKLQLSIRLLKTLISMEEKSLQKEKDEVIAEIVRANIEKYKKELEETENKLKEWKS